MLVSVAYTGKTEEINERSCSWARLRRQPAIGIPKCCYFFSFCLCICIRQVAAKVNCFARLCSYINEPIVENLFGLISTVNLEPFGVLHLCPGSNITFTCTVSLDQAELLSWRAFDENHPDVTPRFFHINDDPGLEYAYAEFFTLFLVSTSPLVSTATFTNGFGPQQNGTNLTCANTVSSNLSPSKGDYAFLTVKGMTL